MIKVVAFNGSPREKGNTALSLGLVTAELEKEGIQTETISLSGQNLSGCVACGKCFENKNQCCVITSDLLNTYAAKMFEADGILLGSPVYYADITANLKALIERCGYVAGANGGLLVRKVGAGVIAVRRGGAIHSFDTINHLFLISQMIIPGSRYWNMTIGRDPGEVLNDQEGVKTMEILGQNMAWLLKKLHPEKALQ